MVSVWFTNHSENQSKKEFEKKMGIPRNRPNYLILILKFLVDFRCFDKLLTLIGIRVDTFISLSFFDQILSADFWSQLSKLFGGENCYQSDYFDTLSSLLSLLTEAGAHWLFSEIFVRKFKRGNQRVLVQNWVKNVGINKCSLSKN